MFPTDINDKLFKVSMFSQKHKYLSYTLVYKQLSFISFHQTLNITPETWQQADILEIVLA